MQLEELFGGSPILARFRELETRVEAAIARSEAALRSALQAKRSMAKQLHVCLSHTHAHQRSASGAVSAPIAALAGSV